MDIFSCQGPAEENKGACVGRGHCCSWPGDRRPGAGKTDQWGGDEEEDGYQRCGQFLPYEQQGWPSFMGINGDSKFNIKSIFHKFVKKAL